jgi:hypothetical protein
VTLGVTLAALAAAVGGASPAGAWTQVTGADLAADCHSTEPTRHATCLGFIQAVYDLQFSPTPPQGVCPPANLSPELLAEVVVAYLDTHDDATAATAIGQSVVRFFPCVQAPKKP